MASHCLRSIPVLGKDRGADLACGECSQLSPGLDAASHEQYLSPPPLLLVVGNLVLPCDSVGTGDKFVYEDTARIEDLTAHR